jgi:hypothetical protein
MPGPFHRPRSQVTVVAPLKGPFECIACRWEMGGYSKKDLEDNEGWEFYDAGKGRTVALCQDCAYDFRERRAVKEAM